MSLRKQIAPYMQYVITIAAMAILALGIGLYIAREQRLKFPWDDVFTVYAEFENAQAVTPGQGQTVNVAGVQVGEIGAVKLKEGRAEVRLDLTSKELGPIYRNATMLLRPKTGLNDMSVALDPGHPDPHLPDDGRVHEGDHLPVENTAPNINPDQVLAALDSDTRRYLAVFASAGGRGLRGRGEDLRRVLQATQPTFARSRRVFRTIADRRAKVKRLVTNFRRLAGAAATKDQELAGLVDNSTAVVETLAARDAELRDSLGRLPGTLSATRNALVESRGLAQELVPAAEEARPLARELGPDLVDARPLLRDATPVVRNDLRPLVRETTPLVRALRPSVKDILTSTPPLIRTGHVLNYVANELGYNPPGKEEGYLFWVPWFLHNANSILSIEDAHGVAWRGLVVVGCSSAGLVFGANPALAPLGTLPICPDNAVPGGILRRKGGAPAPEGTGQRKGDGR